MPTSDHKRNALDQHIDELESLLAERRGALDPAAIPVLDELAETGTATGEASAAPPATLEPKQLVEIWHRLEHRIDAEMADLAEALKTVLKRCIQDELRSCMPAKERRPAATAAAAEADPPPENPKSGMH